MRTEVLLHHTYDRLAELLGAEDGPHVNAVFDMDSLLNLIDHYVRRQCKKSQAPWDTQDLG
jgi:hypothetical protein